MAETDKALKDLNTWFPDGKFKPTMGAEIVLPTLSWGRESKVMKIFLTLINKSGDLKSIFSEGKGEDISPMKLIAILPVWLEQFSDKVSEMVGILINKDVAFVEENLTTEDILRLLVPFFKRLSSIIGGLGRQILPSTLAAPQDSK